MTNREKRRFADKVLTPILQQKYAGETFDIETSNKTIPIFLNYLTEKEVEDNLRMVMSYNVLKNADHCRKSFYRLCWDDIADIKALSGKKKESVPEPETIVTGPTNVSFSTTGMDKKEVYVRIIREIDSRGGFEKFGTIIIDTAGDYVQMMMDVRE